MYSWTNTLIRWWTTSFLILTVSFSVFVSQLSLRAARESCSTARWVGDESAGLGPSADQWSATASHHPSPNNVTCHDHLHASESVYSNIIRIRFTVESKQLSRFEYSGGGSTTATGSWLELTPTGTYLHKGSILMVQWCCCLWFSGTKTAHF